MRYGIPYMGSKRAIADKLMDAMLNAKPNAKYFYDVFGGGGAMSFCALSRGLQVHYNEFYKPMYLLINFLVQRTKNKETGNLGFLPDDWYKFVDRDSFFKIIKGDDAYSQFVRLVYSFGNSGKSYLYGKSREEYKKNYHNLAVYNCQESAKYLSSFLGIDIKTVDLPTIGERRLAIRKAIPKDYFDKNLQNLTNLQTLENLERIKKFEFIQNPHRYEALENLQNLKLDITTSNLCYSKLDITTPIEETIIYCDPPYRNTAGYNNSDFDIEAFDDWFKNLPFLAFLSEYQSPHYLIDSLDKRALMQGGTGNKIKENLYSNKSIEIIKKNQLELF